MTNHPLFPKKAKNWSLPWFVSKSNLVMPINSPLILGHPSTQPKQLYPSTCNSMYRWKKKKRVLNRTMNQFFSENMTQSFLLNYKRPGTELSTESPFLSKGSGSALHASLQTLSWNSSVTQGPEVCCQCVTDFHLLLGLVMNKGNCKSLI